MSKYSTELRYICESLADKTESTGYNSVSEVISTARPLIFNFTYPIHDPTHKEELETKILKHYYGQEIGFETYGRWHLELDKRMNEIMPYYNELYRLASLEYNPLDDVNYTKTHEGTHNEGETETVKNTDDGSSARTVSSSENGETSGNSTSNTQALSLFSDTPQGKVNDFDIQGNVYLTNVTKDTNNTVENDSRTSERTVSTNETSTFEDERNISRQNDRDGEDEFTETMKGKVGTYSFGKLIKDAREQIMNVDMMIIDELQDLFMLVW
jgi:hypothetical protein